MMPLLVIGVVRLAGKKANRMKGRSHYRLYDICFGLSRLVNSSPDVPRLRYGVGDDVFLNHVAWQRLR